MPPKTLTNFRIDHALLDALQVLNAREPEGVSFHVRQAIRDYLRRKDVPIKPERRRRVATRRRS